MNKVLWLIVLMLCKVSIGNAQTLFTYGGKPVSKQEFLAAFNKNPTPENERKNALIDYLNLYSNYKLKVQAGYDEQLNLQPSFLLESKNFKQQIAENLVNEEAGIKTLLEEAFRHSQKDIHAAHIFIEVPQNGDTIQAFQQIQEAYKLLLAGKNFGEIAASFSSDATTKNAKGDLGFITVFTLQYPIESEIYNLKPGKFSKPFHSNFGYHIFKNIEERHALGKRKIAQLLIAIPPNATEADKAKFSKLADSIYNLITHGEPFETAVSKFSNDIRTANTGGVLSDIGVGEFDANYEAHIFGLQKIGDISKPFLTSYGYHIIKLLDVIPVGKTVTDVATNSVLKQAVEKDDRLIASKKLKAKKWLVLTQFKHAIYNENDLWLFTDSSLLNRPLKKVKNITDSTVLFSFPKQKTYTTNWLQYLNKQKVQSKQFYTKKMSDFIDETVIDYYTQHLEDYSGAMQQQTKEFNEANLLFAAMDKHVWGKSGEDISGLKNYYETHKLKYQWASGISALVLTCVNKNIANEVANKIQASPNNWRTIIAAYGTSVIGDSSRYEQQQLPIKQPIQNIIGFTSAPEKNSNDESYTFLYITALHPQQNQRSFDDAKGMVTNDYQQILEQNWLDTLKKKYPVKVNNIVWKTIQ
ncbi:MAG: peptidylprolyl isomerase [Pedobacter sp.]|nr:peptidylprolyl isomerase [Chitinophagaceae bacterium]